MRKQQRWSRGALAGWALSLLVACGGGDDEVSTGSFKVGGAVSALGADTALVLQNNGSDDLTIHQNGSFVFPTRLDSGAAYAVTVKTQPTGQTCTVANGSGTATADVADVAVTCATTGTGGGGGGGGGGGTGPTEGVDGLVGEWVKGICVPVDGKGMRDYVRITKTASNAVQHESGLMGYAATNCSGAGTPVDGTMTPMGPVSFYRSASNTNYAANWGVWTGVTGNNYVIWAKKGENLLCLGVAPGPDLPPTVALVEASYDPTVASGFCYTRR